MDWIVLWLLLLYFCISINSAIISLHWFLLYHLEVQVVERTISNIFTVHTATQLWTLNNYTFCTHWKTQFWIVTLEVSSIIKGTGHPVITNPSISTSEARDIGCTTALSSWISDGLAVQPISADPPLLSNIKLLSLVRLRCLLALRCLVHSYFHQPEIGKGSSYLFCHCTLSRSP